MMQYEPIIIAAIAALTTIIVAWIAKKPIEKVLEVATFKHPQRRPRKKPRPSPARPANRNATNKRRPKRKK